ncbi:MAG: transcriptional regulator [Thiomicrorhabdus chilensis]|uniref:helix-turn-helix transcriptional regulator n=1 Tax=Thiomicrorhabdus chilensis TaxID=63656 RepID=UPI00299E831D|nr:transcriptional regulator [Thiomicrorhabdus chilensis]MDX1348091.1 transcriptional regulator [Thiomicrorhabdus chilensis]
MNKSDRKSSLIEYLPRSECPVKIETLANQLECSTRTIRRYLDELLNERQAPWYVLDGYVYLDKRRQDQIEIYGYWFTSEELFSLLALYKMTDELSAGLLEGHFKEFKQRILQIIGTQEQSQNLMQSVKILPIASPVIDSEQLNKITEAVACQHRLKIEFWNRHTNQVTQREISPYQLVRYRDRWFVDAWCHQKEALRSFSLEAILSIQTLKKQSQPANSEALQNFYQSSYGIFTGQANKVAVLRFSEYQSRWIKDQLWHPGQTSQQLPDGRYQLHLPYREDIELIQDILKYGPEVEVVSPPELRQKVAQRLHQTLAQYENDLA